MLKLYALNNTYIQIECEDDISLELHEYFTMFAENYQHHPLYKARRWNGKLYFYHSRNHAIYAGLVGEVLTFAKERGYSVELDKSVVELFKFPSSITREQFVEFVKSLDIHDYGDQLEIRDYQMLGAWQALTTRRRVFSSNTSSGKSVIQYICIRLLQREIEGKVLLVVPSQNLVEQMYSDFRNYSSTDENWNIEYECCRLYAAYDFDPSKQVVISTWQSLQDKPSDWFEEFEVVMCDEAHQAKAKEIKRIIECCQNASFRLAFTGTVPKGKADKMTLLGLFGPVSVLQTSRQAMDKGYIAELDIKCLQLNHSTYPKKKMKYPEEMDFICSSEKRNKFICNLANSLKGNTLILVARIESHGDVLKKMLDESGTTKKIFYIHGGVDASDRENIRAIMEKEEDAIVIGSFGCVSTGWSVRNLHNVIFGFPSKSFIRVVQSIGRGLRRSSTKSHCVLYDVVDNINENNFAWNHFLERVKIYTEQQFKSSLVEIDL